MGFRALLLALVLEPMLAAADPTENAAYTVADFQSEINDAIDKAVGKMDQEVSLCHGAISLARRGGLKTLAHWQFKPIGKPSADHPEMYEISIERAEQVCVEYAQYSELADHVRVIAEALTSAKVLGPDGAPSPTDVKLALEHAAQCRSEVELVQKAKVSPKLQFRVNGELHSVGEMKSICEAEAKAAAFHSQDAKDARTKQRDDLAKAGLAEDKAELITQNSGSVYLAGGAQPSDLKKYAAAAVWFVWVTVPADDAGYVVHTVRRYQFEGSKLVKTTEKQYKKKKAEKLPTNVFQ